MLSLSLALWPNAHAHVCSDMNTSLQRVQNQLSIARFTSATYTAHEVNSCGRLARRKAGRLVVVCNCLLVAGWKVAWVFEAIF